MHGAVHVLASGSLLGSTASAFQPHCLALLVALLGFVVALSLHCVTYDEWCQLTMVFQATHAACAWWAALSRPSLSTESLPAEVKLAGLRYNHQDSPPVLPCRPSPGINAEMTYDPMTLVHTRDKQQHAELQQQSSGPESLAGRLACWCT